MNKLFLKLLVLFVFTQLVTGCAGLADYTVELPGDYTIFRTSGDMIFIVPKLEDGLYGEKIIDEKVIEVAWDDRYILAKQMGLMTNPENPRYVDVINPEDISYWILDYTTDEVDGPFIESEFIDKRKELGISEDIVLQDVEDLRN